MINSREDYLLYLEHDAKASKRDTLSPKLFGDEVWKFIRLLRKYEYLLNCYKGKKRILIYPMFLVIRYMFHNYSLKLGFSIPPNTCDYGLSIAHYGSVIINRRAKVGRYCRIQTGVTIGSTDGNAQAPVIGDYVFLGDGAKIIGDIEISDYSCIGAGAVVVKSIIESNCTWGGVPAKKISNHGSNAFIKNILK